MRVSPQGVFAGTVLRAVGSESITREHLERTKNPELH
jgi:hypothetical protein